MASIAIHGYNSWRVTASGAQRATDLTNLAKKARINVNPGWLLTDGEIAGLRAANPTAKIYLHTSLIVTASSSPLVCPITPTKAAAEGWYLLDSSGDPIESSATSWYLDPGAEGLADYWYAQCLANAQAHNYDGIVFDHNHVTVPTGSVKYADNTAWRVALWPFYNNTLTKLAADGYELVGNCAGEYGVTVNYDLQRAYYDAVVYEIGFFDWYSGGDCAYRSGADIATLLTRLRDDPKEVWLSNGGCQDDVTAFATKSKLACAGYYIGLPESAELQAKRWFNVANDWYPYWPAWYDLDIGTPTSAYIQPATYFWVRQFSGGIVLFNYSTSAVDYALPGYYVDENAVSYSGTVNVPARTGLILQSTAAPSSTRYTWPTRIRRFTKERRIRDDDKR
jgi:hypothetical protein